jgi:hypothetical protein
MRRAGDWEKFADIDDNSTIPAAGSEFNGSKFPSRTGRHDRAGSIFTTMVPIAE